MVTSTSRHTFRVALADIAQKAKATLPECHGRVDAAIALVLAGDVELCTDGSALVGSQADPQKSYRVIHGQCECPDFVRAPAEFCKHRLAVGLLRRANELLASAADGAAVPVAGDPLTRLPEAPVSITLKAILHGHEVLVTLRGHDFASVQTQVAQALDWLKAQTQAQASSPAEGWCALHQVQMQHNQKDGRTWWSHKTAEGWCKGR